MQAIRLTPVLGILAVHLAVSIPVAAQERAADGPSGRFAALDELDASYRRQLHDLECRRIADLAALADKAPAPEADAAYRQLFGLAIARELCREAAYGGDPMPGVDLRRPRRPRPGRAVQVLSAHRQGRARPGPRRLEESPPGVRPRALTPPSMPISRWPSARRCSSV